jgi:long-subunit acyl-CoA synthetase (AMP-forming)
MGGRRAGSDQHPARGRGVRYILDDATPEVVICDDACLPLLSEGLPRIKTRIHLGQARPPAGWLSYEVLIAQAEPADDAERRDNDLAGIFYTGGSTGKSKGAMLSLTISSATP